MKSTILRGVFWFNITCIILSHLVTSQYIISDDPINYWNDQTFQESSVQLLEFQCIGTGNNPVVTSFTLQTGPYRNITEEFIQTCYPVEYRFLKQLDGYGPEESSTQELQLSESTNRYGFTPANSSDIPDIYATAEALSGDVANVDNGTAATLLPRRRLLQACSAKEYFFQYSRDLASQAHCNKNDDDLAEEGTYTSQFNNAKLQEQQSMALHFMYLRANASLTADMKWWQSFQALNQTEQGWFDQDAILRQQQQQFAVQIGQDLSNSISNLTQIDNAISNLGRVTTNTFSSVLNDVNGLQAQTVQIAGAGTEYANILGVATQTLQSILQQNGDKLQLGQQATQQLGISFSNLASALADAIQDTSKLATFTDWFYQNIAQVTVTHPNRKAFLSSDGQAPDLIDAFTGRYRSMETTTYWYATNYQPAIGAPRLWWHQVQENLRCDTFYLLNTTQQKTTFTYILSQIGPAHCQVPQTTTGNGIPTMGSGSGTGPPCKCWLEQIRDDRCDWVPGVVWDWSTLPLWGTPQVPQLTGSLACAANSDHHNLSPVTTFITSLPAIEQGWTQWCTIANLAGAGLIRVGSRNWQTYSLVSGSSLNCATDILTIINMARTAPTLPYTMISGWLLGFQVFANTRSDLHALFFGTIPSSVSWTTKPYQYSDKGQSVTRATTLKYLETSWTQVPYNLLTPVGIIKRATLQRVSDGQLFPSMKVSVTVPYVSLLQSLTRMLLPGYWDCMFSECVYTEGQSTLARSTYDVPSAETVQNPDPMARKNKVNYLRTASLGDSDNDQYTGTNKRPMTDFEEIFTIDPDSFFDVEWAINSLHKFHVPIILDPNGRPRCAARERRGGNWCRILDRFALNAQDQDPADEPVRTIPKRPDQLHYFGFIPDDWTMNPTFRLPLGLITQNLFRGCPNMTFWDNGASAPQLTIDTLATQRIYQVRSTITTIGSNMRVDPCYRHWLTTIAPGQSAAWSWPLCGTLQQNWQVSAQLGNDDTWQLCKQYNWIPLWPSTQQLSDSFTISQQTYKSDSVQSITNVMGQQVQMMDRLGAAAATDVQTLDWSKAVSEGTSLSAPALKALAAELANFTADNNAVIQQAYTDQSYLEQLVAQENEQLTTMNMEVQAWLGQAHDLLALNQQLIGLNAQGQALSDQISFWEQVQLQDWTDWEHALVIVPVDPESLFDASHFPPAAFDILVKLPCSTWENPPTTEGYYCWNQPSWKPLCDAGSGLLPFGAFVVIGLLSMVLFYSFICCPCCKCCRAQSALWCGNYNCFEDLSLEQRRQLWTWYTIESGREIHRKIRPATKFKANNKSRRKNKNRSNEDSPVESNLIIIPERSNIEFESIEMSSVTTNPFTDQS